MRIAEIAASIPEANAPGGPVSDRSLEAVLAAAKELKQMIHSVMDPDVKGKLNYLLAQPLSTVIFKLEQKLGQAER